MIRDIYQSDQPMGRPMVVAMTLHVILFASAIAGPYIFNRSAGENWGGTDIGGDAISANIVSNIPLPRQQGTNVLATESKGVTVSKPKEEEKEPDAIPIADKNKKTKKSESKTATNLKPPTDKIPEVPPNSIPYGQGGPVNGPYGSFNTNNAKGGFGFNNGGDFGSRFSWYVDQVRRKVSENWLQYEIDPTIKSARRVYIQFDINRSGSPQNVEVEQSSGIPSLDQSAVRALKRIDSFGPLPAGYSGNKVSVEFWFDYRR